MSKSNKYTQEVKTTIENLIEAGTTFNVDELEKIYHDDLEIIMIDEKGETMIANKNMFKNIFQAKKNNGDTPLNTWAKFNFIDANKDKGLVVITRKVNLTGEERLLTLSIDLTRNKNHWQVIKEVIFSQPIL